ncbi:hypothetical protein Prudu_001537 [Prunus dulcis]|uniref:Uncharacterized protein n=1 Tax=Prunus dulcis TaxID=3755 RepID=A0A4Y1QNR5_PRUDU|nr:hypothetical protein Prudu_001537 [Prunus dulcis]
MRFYERTTCGLILKEGINFGKCPIYRGDSAEIFGRKPRSLVWARHRGDVRNSKGFVSDYGKIRGGSFHTSLT